MVKHRNYGQKKKKSSIARKSRTKPNIFEKKNDCAVLLRNYQALKFLSKNYSDRNRNVGKKLRLFYYYFLILIEIRILVKHQNFQ